MNHSVRWAFAGSSSRVLKKLVSVARLYQLMLVSCFRVPNLISETGVDSPLRPGLLGKEIGVELLNVKTWIRH